jgi:hypothetical protein
MKEYWNKCWKGLATFVGVLAMVTAIVTFYSNLATSADLAQVKQEFKQSMELDRNLNKMDRINDNLIRLKILQKQYPSDKEIKEELESLKIEKVKVQEKIDKR